MTALEAANAMYAAIKRVNVRYDVDLCPIGDGGEGTIQALLTSLPQKPGLRHDGRALQYQTVTGPRGTSYPARGKYCIFDHLTRPATLEAPVGFVELASAAGHIAPENNTSTPPINPLHTTTFGVGELIAHVAKQSCKTIIVGLGGSVTCDAGCGIAQALGAQFTLQSGETLSHISRPFTGTDLHNITSINLANMWSAIGIAKPPAMIAICDVNNPLTGKTGAATIYAPQKGASQSEVQLLSAGLAHLATIATDDNTALSAQTVGTGAAGGAAFGLAAFANAELHSGIRYILKMIDFQRRIRKADLVITGEGCLDQQTNYGKAISGIVEICESANTPVIALVGKVQNKRTRGKQNAASTFNKLTEYHLLTDLVGIGNKTAMNKAPLALTKLTEHVIRKFIQTQ